MEEVLDKDQVAHEERKHPGVTSVQFFICWENNKENDEHQVC